MQILLFVCVLGSNTIADRLVLVLVLACLVDLGIAREYFPMAYKLLS